MCCPRCWTTPQLLISSEARKPTNEGSLPPLRATLAGDWKALQFQSLAVGAKRTELAGTAPHVTLLFRRASKTARESTRCRAGMGSFGPRSWAVKNQGRKTLFGATITNVTRSGRAASVFRGRCVCGTGPVNCLRSTEPTAGNSRINALRK